MEINSDVISQFMTGRDEQKYIVAIEAAYNDNLAYVVVNDPEKGKYIERFKYKPFLWMKEEVGHMLYDGNKTKLRAAMQKYGITIKKLRTSNADGITPSRMDKGFKFLVTCSESHSKLNWFFKEGGFNPREGDNSKLIFKFAPDEQFMIQTGKRLFKGFEDYDDLHRLQFDLETQGLDPMGNPIFQIGIRDNRGYERIIEVVGNTPQELRDAERTAIVEFFKVIDDIQPDIIAGYNSANFDWPFLYKRSDRLSVDITKFVKGLDNETPIKDSDWNLKMGQETERYSQTLLWGYNVLDISHSVRRAQAINSSIKSWSLKYITKFSKAQKPNRVYIDGDKIYTTWKDTENVYYFNEDNGDWFKHVDGSLEQEEIVSTGDYDEVTGAYIVERYLLDDLWETEKIDNIYNQAPFLLAKSIPTSYMRSSTMGTAGQWSLMLAAWSYEHGLAIPDYEKKREFTGGLSRLLETGFAEEVGKLDYAALYPKTTLTYGIFPDTDISGVFKGLLTYIVDNRDKYKFLVEEYKEKVTELSKLEPTEENKTLIEKYSKMASDYDKKQLPLKILANSFYGAYGAPYIFPWGDTMCAEKITCMSRQHLRLMVRTFTEKWGFKALVLDTDGVNFSIPDNVNDFKYTALGDHWKTTKYKGIELCGLDACLAYFNENYMEGWMGLDVDDVCKATINFKRKNYANLIGTKVKFVGNSIKSKAMPTYIEDFLDKGIKLLLDGKGYDFINYYYEYIEDIYNYRIPLVKIASKAKVKQTVSQYIEDCKTRTKSGSLKARKAHMELILHHDMSPKLGDVIYYVNTAETKSKGDVQMVKDRKTKESKIVINCKLISQEDIENNPNYITDEYNVHKYIDAFNTRIAPLLVVFSKDIRGKILLDMVKDKKTKQYQLQDRYYFTESECKLVSGQPLEESDQDTYEQLMTMENKEIRFWMMANEVPNRLTIDEWDTVKQDYFNRKADGLKHDLDVLKSVCVKLELNQLKSITNNGKLPTAVSDVVRMDESGNLISKEWAEPIADLSIVFDYMDMAKFRDKFYRKFSITGTKKYDKWLKFVNAAKIPDTFTLDDYTSLFTDISEYTLKELMNLDNGILNTLMSRRVKDVEPVKSIDETPIVLSGDLMTDMFVFMNEVESL